jgi:hypothetical protein
MENSTSIFKFVTIRNASNAVNARPDFDIQPETTLVKDLVAALESDKPQADRIALMNQKLDTFIKSANFYKSKLEVNEAVNKPLDKSKTAKTAKEPESADALTLYKNLYNNIVIRSITKSNTTEIYKLLVEHIKKMHQKIHADKISETDMRQLRILLPENLIISFKPTTKPVVAAEDTHAATSAALNVQIQNLHTETTKIQLAKKVNDIAIRVEQKKIITNQGQSVPKGNASSTAKRTGTQAATIPNAQALEALEKLKDVSESLKVQEEDVSLKLTYLTNQAFQFVPQLSYVQIGTKWTKVPNLDKPLPPKPEPDTIVVYANGCYLKFPFQVADLRVVEQKTVGYVPAEIAHINNTQQGEKQEKITRRLKRLETFESLISESEVSKETDTQSTEKFSLEKASSEVQAEESAANVNASATGTYGVVTASLDAGYSYGEASQNSNSSSQSYAKEIVQRVVDRVSNKVKKERSVKSIEEFEETVTHIIDNTEGDGPKSYVYRWLTKLVRATLKNYGKRLIFQIDVAHPSHYYLSRAIQEAVPLNIPPNPRDLKKGSGDQIIKDFYLKTNFPYYFSVDAISKDNYLAWGELYNVKLEQPPKADMIASFKYAQADGQSAKADASITIPAGYKAKTANIVFYYRKLSQDFLSLMIGRHGIVFWDVQPLTTISLNGETGELPVSILQMASGYNINIEIDCVLEEATLSAWQIKCYHAIVEAYDNLKAEAESKMSDWNPNNPGLNPSRKTELIKTELKKGALSKMFRCNPFWITDNYVVGKEYDPDCCKDSMNAEKVRFLETVFDWKNMSYDLHPYFYTYHDAQNPNADNWGKLLNLTDDDPHFEAFLQSSYATVRIPVHRDSEKEIAAINFIINNSIANHSVVPASLQHLLQDLEANTPFGFIPENSSNADFIDIKKEYDKAGKLKIFYLDESNNEIVCTEKLEWDKEGNETLFYYDSAEKPVISEIKEGINSNGQKYFYYFNAKDEKVICHKAKTEYDLEGNETPYYAIDLGVFTIPTDLVILEKGVENGVVLRGYPEDTSEPTSDVVIPKQYSPTIIQER